MNRKSFLGLFQVLLGVFTVGGGVFVWQRNKGIAEPCNKPLICQSCLEFENNCSLDKAKNARAVIKKEKEFILK